MLGQRLLRWSNIVPTLGERLVFDETMLFWKIVKIINDY